MAFKVIRQKDAMQCGVAALAMVCRHHGQRYTTQFLERFCHPTTEGVSMLGMAQAAERLGMESVSARITVDKLIECPLPCILHWNQNHFVVLHKISHRGRRFHVADPAKGLLTYTRKEFYDRWAQIKSEDGSKGVAMLLRPTDKFGSVTETTDSKSGAISFMSGYFSDYKNYFLRIFLLLLSGCVLQLVLPFLTQSIVDVGIRNNDITFIWLVLAGELTIVVGQTATDFIQRRLLLRVSMHINISLISDFIAKLLQLPMAFFDTKLHGDILQRMGDHSRVQSFLTGRALNMAFTLLSLLIFSIVLAIYNTFVFSVFICGTTLYATWIVLFMHKRKVLDYELFECQAVSQNRTWQLITTMHEIKLQDCGERRRQEWADTQTRLYAIQMKSLKLQQTQEAGAVFINETKNIIVTALSAATVIGGDMSLGAMLAVQYIVGQLNSPVEQLMAFILSFQDVRISLERINEVHGSDNEGPARDGAESYAQEGRDIIFSGVSFRYDRHAMHNTLEDIDITIPEGRVTAIVGASGSGKTTLIKLMLGYYPAEKGHIYVAGKDINFYNPRWWRKRCGVVMQDGVIFSDSIARNIAVSDDEIDQQRLTEAAKTACIHNYVNDLPLKYDTKIGPDGVGLSQGQRQRILIARAVYRNPDYIFLDEATNALDTHNEREIVDNLKEFYKGRTVIVAAHRLSTVKDADNIIVMDHGKVAETGTHESLVRLKGLYYNLILNQLELGG